MASSDRRRAAWLLTFMILGCISCLYTPKAGAQRVNNGPLQWYVGISGASGFKMNMRHDDTFLVRTCWETAVTCEPRKAGNWSYSSSKVADRFVSFAAGVQFRAIRIELSAARQSTGMLQQFLKDVQMEPLSRGIVRTQSQTGPGRFNGNFTAQSLILSSSYVFSKGRVSVFAGGGLGYTDVTAKSSVDDWGRTCLLDINCRLEPSTIDDASIDRLQGPRMSIHLVAGAEYHIGRGVHVGLKSVYSRFANTVQTFEFSDTPERHPIDLEVKGMYSLSLAASLRYSFRL